MLSIGLTGNRMAGKKTVSNIFKQIGVPVFDADLVLKYLLNYRQDVTLSVLGNMGPEYLYQDSYIDLSKFDTDDKFNDLLDLVEWDIMEYYRNFQERNQGSLYTIFKSSWIFERGIESRFDTIISVYATLEERVLRYRSERNKPLSETYVQFKTEIEDIDKNLKSDYVIHSYDSGLDLLDQINSIDKLIIDKILEKEIQHD